MNEILKVITWPHVVFLVSVIFIFVFKRPLSNLISRTTSIDKEGLKAGSSLESQQENTGTTNEAVQQLLDAVGSSIVINDQEEKIKQELKEKGLITESDSEKVLIKHLAGTQLLLAFERIHNSIFGSQITLLKKLNKLRNGIAEDLVNEYIKNILDLDPDGWKDWNAERFLLFLFSNLLIVRKEEKLHITNLGVEYLTWIAREGLDEDLAL